MSAAVLAFVAGVLLLQRQAELPASAWLWLLPACAAGAVWAAVSAPRRAPARRALVLLLAFACGFLWAATHAQWRLADRLAPELEGRDLELVGTVAGLPVAGERGLRFEFDVESAAHGARVPHRLRLAWYWASTANAVEETITPVLEQLPLRPGERWRLTARLRRPHGNVNPHGFDYEAWLLERGIGATGTVRARPAPERIGARNSVLDRVEQARDAVRKRYLDMLGDTPAAGILIALAVGEQRSISNEEWRLFQRTGVTHLMSISGLHVTLVSGLVAWLVGFGWRQAPRLCHALPARKAAAAAAIAAALGYALLAGFAVPAQRTFLMVTVVALALWSGRIASPSRTLALALFAVVLADPWAPLAPGFWLSFGAVALIFYAFAGASAPEPRPLQWARVQWAITAGLAPAALLLFAQVSVVGPLANAVAIPLVSAVITPLALLGAALPLELLLAVASGLVEWLLEFLEWCASLPLALWEQQVPPLWSVLLALLGVAWLIAPRGVPWRVTGLALMLPALMLPAASPPRGEAWITTLDVGQGLAVLVRTETRALIYDAGPAYGLQSDSGVRVILPLLRAAGVTRLDALVLTHHDLDHIGGATSVLAGIETDALVSSLPPSHALLVLAPLRRRCIAGEHWEWDGVRFELLHPAREDYGAMRRANDLSCVLRVSAGAHAMLLTGDLERAGESALLARAVGMLRADVLLVPHHGSRTSSSTELLAAVAPRWGVIAAGYGNRFGHPSDEVLERYRARGIELLRTDRVGAVSVRLGAAHLDVEGERAVRARYWRAP